MKIDDSKTTIKKLAAFFLIIFLIINVMSMLSDALNLKSENSIPITKTTIGDWYTSYDVNSKYYGLCREKINSNKTEKQCYYTNDTYRAVQGFNYAIEQIERLVGRKK
jgi:hypothetical protein